MTKRQKGILKQIMESDLTGRQKRQAIKSFDFGYWRGYKKVHDLPGGKTVPCVDGKNTKDEVVRCTICLAQPELPVERIIAMARLTPRFRT